MKKTLFLSILMLGFVSLGFAQQPAVSNGSQAMPDQYMQQEMPVAQDVNIEKTEAPAFKSKKTFKKTIKKALFQSLLPGKRTVAGEKSSMVSFLALWLIALAAAILFWVLAVVFALSLSGIMALIFYLLAVLASIASFVFFILWLVNEV